MLFCSSPCAIPQHEMSTPERAPEVPTSPAPGLQRGQSVGHDRTTPAYGALQSTKEDCNMPNPAGCTAAVNARSRPVFRGVHGSGACMHHLTGRTPLPTAPPDAKLRRATRAACGGSSCASWTRRGGSTWYSWAALCWRTSCASAPSSGSPQPNGPRTLAARC